MQLPAPSDAKLYIRNRAPRASLSSRTPSVGNVRLRDVGSLSPVHASCLMNVAALLDRQRHVNECLKDEMERIHALQMKTWTVEQYEKKKTAA